MKTKIEHKIDQLQLSFESLAEAAKEAERFAPQVAEDVQQLENRMRAILAEHGRASEELHRNLCRDLATEVATIGAEIRKYSAGRGLRIVDDSPARIAEHVSPELSKKRPKLVENKSEVS